MNTQLISFRMDWFDLLAVQRTFKSLLQHHILKASILQNSVFFMVQLSHPYMTTRKTIAFPTQTFVGSDIFAFQYAVCAAAILSCSGMSDSLRHHGL